MKKICYLFIIIMLAGCSARNTPPVDGEKKIEYANALYNRELYAQAIEEYKDLLKNYKLSGNVRININAKIAETYFERMEDYQNALAFYLKLIHVFPESDFEKTAQKRKIACLERMGRSTDAAQALRETTSLEPKEDMSKYSGDIVAVIDGQKITTGYIDHRLNKELSRIPAQMRPDKIGKEEKLAVLRQYLIVELLYKKAKRTGLDKNPEIIAEAFQAKKMMMASKIQQKELEGKIQINAKDAELYYNANKDKFTEKDKDGKVTRQKPFSEVGEQAYSMLRQEKEREAMDALLQELMNAENVKIYADKIK